MLAKGRNASARGQDRGSSRAALERSAVPLYLQLAAVLKRRIFSGEWPPGQQIPTLEELTQQFGVARVTARQAVGTLEQEGLIWRRQGKGTFVADGVSTQRWLTLESDWSSLVRIKIGRASCRERVCQYV